MSDENVNSNENEETAALFVSAQKKKKAEEEARQKAAEEQAKREAAEAEVRRMEEEVEERRRRAEEEKRALEEAQKAAEAGKQAAAADAAKSAAKAAEAKDSTTSGASAKKAVTDALKTKSADGAKSKLPLFAGIGGALVAILILVFVLGGKKGAKVDYDNLDFNAEYTPAEEGFDLKLHYPDSVYSEVTEEKTGDGEVTLHLIPKSKGAVSTDVILSTYLWEDTKTPIPRIGANLSPAKDMQSGFKNKISAKLKEILPDIKVTSESETDVTDDNAGPFFYTCAYESADNGNGNATAWIGFNGAGEAKRVLVNCKADGKDAAAAGKVCDLFLAKNTDDALKVPGAQPPTSTDTDGLLEVDLMHMGIIVPKGMFQPYPSGSSDLQVFVDANGASIVVQGFESQIDLNDPSLDYDKLHALYKSWGDAGINEYYKGVDSRMFLDESYDSGGIHLDYTANYKDMVGGVAYWERYRTGHWTDVRTNTNYTYILITMAPERNEIYHEIFDKALDRLQDL